MKLFIQKKQFFYWNYFPIQGDYLVKIMISILQFSSFPVKTIQVHVIHYKNA
jgi:hypothetical protein